ncbi:PAPA-1-like conserved region-domain-containing protein [Lipomyces oligophaga]|uniref:PAPA-1-like conserved region-domain-containing protein n=1 Tax=Lipomyces oligophaga TaxID=45792 RepID=UPI0034CD496A
MNDDIEDQDDIEDAEDLEELEGDEGEDEAQQTRVPGSKTARSKRSRIRIKKAPPKQPSKRSRPKVMKDDSDDAIEDSSQAEYPDISRLTDRQRARYLDESIDLQALPNEAVRKKIFTEEELMLRRTETARRRKNLSEKRKEEEKMDTINRLLKKQAPKRKGKVKNGPGSPGTPMPENAPTDQRLHHIDPYLTKHVFRWVSSKSGIVMGIPDGIE